MKELKPAHEVIIEEIKQHCQNLEGIERQPPSETRFPSTHDFIEGVSRASEIGALCGLLETLQQMVIPPDKLDTVIAELQEITYVHLAIGATIEDLEQRKS